MGRGPDHYRGKSTNNGYAWYGVSGDAGWGWCAGVTLERIAEATVADDGFAIGDKVVVSTDMLNIRTSAGRSAPVTASLPYGTAGEVTDGPIRADGYVWHEIDTDYGRGWAVGVYLAARGSGVVFAVGDTVVVDTNAVVLHSAPTLNSRELIAVPRGEELTITDPPVRQDGHDWYGVRKRRVRHRLGRRRLPDPGLGFGSWVFGFGKGRRRTSTCWYPSRSAGCEPCNGSP